MTERTIIHDIAHQCAVGLLAATAEINLQLAGMQSPVRVNIPKEISVHCEGLNYTFDFGLALNDFK